MTSKPKIWVTRPEPDATETAAKLAGLGFDPMIAPLMEMRVLPPNLPNAAGFAAIALTSTNALRALEQLDALKSYLHLPAFCVGARTAEAARQAGFTEIHSANGDFDDLTQLIARQESAGPIFYPKGQHVSGDLAAALAPANRLVIASATYEMQPVANISHDIISALDVGELAAISFYSRRTTQIFIDLVKDLPALEQIRTLAVLCLSENVAQPLLQNHFTHIALADYPSEEAMMALALSVLRGHIGT